MPYGSLALPAVPPPNHSRPRNESTINAMTDEWNKGDRFPFDDDMYCEEHGTCSCTRNGPVIWDREADCGLHCRGSHHGQFCHDASIYVGVVSQTGGPSLFTPGAGVEERLREWAQKAASGGVDMEDLVPMVINPEDPVTWTSDVKFEPPKTGDWPDSEPIFFDGERTMQIESHGPFDIIWTPNEGEPFDLTEAAVRLEWHPDEEGSMVGRRGRLALTFVLHEALDFRFNGVDTPGTLWLGSEKVGWGEVFSNCVEQSTQVETSEDAAKNWCTRTWECLHVGPFRMIAGNAPWAYVKESHTA